MSGTWRFEVWRGIVRTARMGPWVLAAALAGCGEKNENTDLAARVGNSGIPAQAFEERLNHRAAAGRTLSKEEKWALLEELIDFEAAYAKAIEAGVDRRPEVREAVKRLVVRRYTEEFEGQAPAAIDEAMIEGSYRDRIRDYTEPEARRIALVHIATAGVHTIESEEKCRLRAEEAHAAAVQEEDLGEGFGWVARRFSEHRSSRYFGGVQDWLTIEEAKERWPAEVAAAFFSQETGEIGPVIRAEDGYYLVKVMAVRPSRPQPLAEVREVVRHRLEKEAEAARKESFRQTLRRGLEVHVNREVVERVNGAAALASTAAPQIPGD